MRNMERKRSDRIADALEGLIFDGTFADGDRLDEVQLAGRFSVSERRSGKPFTGFPSPVWWCRFPAAVSSSGNLARWN